MHLAIVKNNGVLMMGDSSFLFPNISFPVDGPDPEFLEQNSAMVVVNWQSFNPEIEKLEPTKPYVKDGKVYTFQIVQKTETELLINAAKVRERFMSSITAQVQVRLDEFAKTRNYDSILSACTYATSSVIEFKTDGQKAVELRDATWIAFYSFLAEVNAGDKPSPTSFSEIEVVLPALVW